MSRIATIIGPADHGRRMTLDEFDHAEVQDGHLFELGRGVITVSDVPGLRHMQIVERVRMELAAYRFANPLFVHAVLSGSECKLMVEGLESERHPDLSIYKTAPPQESDDIWRGWTPEIVIEIVLPSSEERDYQEKPEEYLRFGVQEYWIVDPQKSQVSVLRHRGGRFAETILRPGEHLSTRLLPGLQISISALFGSAA